MIPKPRSSSIKITMDCIDTKSPTIPVRDLFNNKKCQAQHISEAKTTISSSTLLLTVPPRLRRSKSLPANFKDERGAKSLFWFRPDPDKALADTPATRPPIKTRSVLRVSRQHRRAATAPDPFIPKELSLPTLQEEEEPSLFKTYCLREDSCETELSNYSEDEGEEDDLDLQGLTFLGRDE